VVSGQKSESLPNLKTQDLKPMNTRKWLIVAGCVVVLALIVFGTDWFSSGKAVEVARAKTGRIRSFIDEQGKTRLPQTYLITMPITGRIEAIGLVEGMQVRKGEVVARIVPRDLELSVAEAKAAVERLEASLAENADVAVEETAYQQALQFVKSTAATVLAAAERMTAGKARLDYAERDLGRVRQLASTGARTQDDLERAVLEQVQSDVNYKQDRLVHAAMQAMAAATDLMPTMVRQYIQRKQLSGAVLQKQKAEAEARLQQVLQEQRRGAMLSPVDGVVLDRLVSNERYLAAGTTLLEIGRLEDMEVEADVLSLDVVAAKVGDPVEIYGPAIGRIPARGTVARVFPAGFTKVSSLGVEQQRVKVVVSFDPGELNRLLQQQRLGVGYHVRVKIFTADKTQALLVPRSALFRAADNAWQVFVVRGGRARLQNVEVGLINDEQVEITKGIADGEPVILAPESNLTDGAKVHAGG
jgi:HlyD family secretion protein